MTITIWRWARLVPYKCTDILIGACAELGRRLVIVGDGPERKKLEKLATKNVEFLGEVDDAALRQVYANARALLFAADEDFGLVPLEAQSYGRPVIAYGKGGSLETVVGTYPSPGRRYEREDTSASTGVFFESQTVDSLVKAIRTFESSEESFSPLVAQKHARQFDTSIFVERLGSFINSAITNPGS